MFNNTIIGFNSNSIYHTLKLSFILLLFLSFTSCESENNITLIPNEDISTFRIETNDSSEGVHNESMGTIETRGLTAIPNICTSTWNNPPGCPACQVHHSDGASFYFYCNNCIDYFTVCGKSRIKINDSNGLNYATSALSGNLYSYDLGSGYNNTLKLSSQRTAPLGTEIITYYAFNC